MQHIKKGESKTGKLSFIITLILLLTIQILFAEDTGIMVHPFNWHNPDKVKLKNQDLAFTNSKYHFPASDSVYFMSYFNNGWVLMLSFICLKHGPLERWGIYSLVSEPDGTSYWAAHHINKKDIKIEPDRFSVKDKKNSIHGNDMTYYIKFDFEGFSCDLTYQNLLPPWQPGDSWAYMTRDKQAFFRLIVNSPWAKVTGTITLNDKTINVKGQGYGDRFLSVYPLRKINPYVYSIRAFSTEDTNPEDRWFFGLLENITHESYGSKRIPILLLAHGNEWILTTQNYTMETTDFVFEPEIPYKYPKRVKIKCNTQGFKLEGEYVSRKLFNFTDVIDEFPKLLREILLIFLDRPVYFRSLGEFSGTVTMPDGTVHNLQLFGPHEYIVVK